MAAVSYCADCGTANSPNLVACSLCGLRMTGTARKNPVNSYTLRAKPMAVFDIDMTLLNNEQRYKDAKRAGIIDKDSKPKRKTKFETPGKAFKRAQEFLFDSARLQKDKLIPGAADFVNSLVEQGYIIAYCTARRLTFYEVTKRQLENKGFPLMMDDMGRELLFMKSGGSDTSAKYKQTVITQLNSSYDVRFFFDDMVENLQAVAQVGVPGLYPSIKAYTDLSTKSNPYREVSEDDFFPGDTEVAPTYMTAQTIPITALQNPPVKPQRKKMKNGKYRKEPAKKYIDRFMGNSKMVSEFPDRGQRYAVSLRYVEKFYGKSGLDSVGARRNPEEYSENYMVPRDIHRLGKAADRLEDTYEDGQKVPEWWKSKMSVAAKDTDTLADALDYVAEDPAKTLPIFAGTPTSKFTNKGMVSSEIQIGRNVFKDVGEVVQSIYRGLVGGRTQLAEKRMAMAMATMQKELSDRAKKLGANAIANLSVDYELLDQSATLTLIATADAIKMTRPPKSNPGHSRGSLPFRPTSDCFLTYKGKLVAKDMGHYIAFPGGGVDPGESPKAAAKREVMEEVGAVLKGDLKPMGDISWVWNPEWADSPKRKKRYQQFQGEQVYFFTGEVEKFVKPTSDEGDAWSGSKLMKFSDAIAYLQAEKANLKHPNQAKYIDYQIACLSQIQKAKGKMTGAQYRAGVKKMLEAKANPRSNPRKNPSHEKKVEKGKKLYKHMNGKEPEKITKQKIDMGDVWYQVGEGGCWQIGYMSGKETGSSSQKYTHTFNEETQDGNFPKLYATMPENGKPLLIIQGGTWKIKTDDKGVAWIYD